MIVQYIATALASAMDGTAIHATDDDSFSAALKCHVTSGEIFTVAFTQTKITISSYEDEAIRTTVENRADTVPAPA